MKLKASVLVALFLTVIANAADDAKTLKSLKKIETMAGDWVGNGSIDLTTYDVEKLNIGKELASIKERFSNWGNCKFNTLVGRTENLAMMKKMKLNEETTVDEELASLHSRKRLKTILGAHWDGETGEGVSCSVYYFEIYTTGGSLLVLDYQLTD